MRIAVIGPQNTGKTTFIKDFLGSLKQYTSPKLTYRDIVKNNKLAINQKTTEESQRIIGEFLFESIKETSGSHVIFDRCVIDNYIYTMIAYRKKVVSKELLIKTEKLMLENLRYLDCLIFIPTAVSVSLVNDTLRDTDKDFIDEVNNCFISTLLDIRSKYFIPVFIISGDRKERIRKVKNILG